MGQFLIFFIFEMSKRKLGSLFLMSPIIVFVLLSIVAVILVGLMPSIKEHSITILIVVVSLVILSFLIWLPLGIVKIVNSKWSFSIWDINRFSRWEAKKKFWTFFLFILTYLAINIVLWEVLDPESKDQMISSIWWVISLFVSTFFTLGVTNISLIVADKKKLIYKALFEKIKYFFHFLVTYVLYILIVVGWTILFIVPWIYRGVRFTFYQYFIVDKKYTPIKALKASRAITKGKFRDVFAYTLLLWLINLLWVLCLFVGLLWTVPMTMIAKAKMYRALSE